MHVIKGRTPRPAAGTTDEREVLARATGRMHAAKLIDLIDESAPDEGVVDVHEIEAKFANGSRRIPLVPPNDVGGAVVEAVVEGGADTTRRMSAVEADALVATEIRGESTMRMSAIQEHELVALIKPDEPPAAPVVRFSHSSEMAAPRAMMSVPEDDDDLVIAVEQSAEPSIAEPPVRRRSNAWMIGALIAFAGAAAGLAAVLLS